MFIIFTFLRLQSDILSMTIYELICEEEQTELYNTLLSPVEEESQVSFSCHMRRGGIDSKQAQIYELIQFIGYFSKRCLKIPTPILF